MDQKVNAYSKELDSKYKLVADTIRLYPNQLKQAWDEIGFMFIPSDFKDVDNIVFCGMGGSALGARMVKSYAFSSLRVPFEIYNDYRLPNYVNSKSLVIVSSYSGSTEETVESAYKAIKKRAKIFCISTGGPLSDVCKKERIPSYIFDPIYNPSAQPRMAIGYSLGATLSLLNKLKFLNVSADDVDEAMSIGFKVLTEYHENAPSHKNQALSYASSLINKIPILVASEHLLGVAHTIKNQLNESAKTFSALFDIPELNHHLMEGLSNPHKQKELLSFFFLSSSLYDERVQKRFKITQDVLEKNNISYEIYKPISENHLSQVMETLILGSFTVYFLTKYYKIDPLEIPWVNYFKKQLAKL